MKISKDEFFERMKEAPLSPIKIPFIKINDIDHAIIHYQPSPNNKNYKNSDEKYLWGVLNTKTNQFIYKKYYQTQVKMKPFKKIVNFLYKIYRENNLTFIK